MDVNAIVDGPGGGPAERALERGGAMNVKRYVRRDVKPQSGKTRFGTYWILDTAEITTAWHPIGL